MITICCDFYHTQQVVPDTYTLVVDQVEDYVPLRQSIRRALDDRDHHYIIYVQSRILAKWLNDLREYSPQIVSWEELNFATQFQKRFGFSPPAELEEAAIPHLLTLTLPPPDPSDLDDPVGWLLSQCLHTVWKPSKLYKGHLAELVAWSVEGNQIPTEFMALAESRLRQWAESDPRYQAFYEQAWQKVGEGILLRWALRSYPLNCTLRQRLDAFPLEDCGQFAPVCHRLLTGHEQELRQFWSLWLAPRNVQGIVTALQQMSGLADAEVYALDQWIQSHRDQLDRELIDAISERFSALSPSQLSIPLELWGRLIPPLLPRRPDILWSSEAWLSWATQEYFPYFAWVIREGQPREVQIEFANLFADWLVNAYPQLLFDQHAPVITNQQSFIKELLRLRQVDVVFWFIIDGLTWWQGETFISLCHHEANNELLINKTRPVLSALPSITSVSKRALVQGYLDPVTAALPIAQLLGKTFTQQGIDSCISNQAFEIQRAISAGLKPGVYALFYNALDRQNHESRGFTDDESVEGHLKRVVRLAREGFSAAQKQDLRAVGFVSSDHGSTLLPPQCPVLAVPQFAHELGDEELLESDLSSKVEPTYQRTRACTIEKVPSEEELHRIERDWYLLRQDVFNLPRHFLLPKSYKAVERRPGGWTHGGATPEETIVAFIELEPAPASPMTSPPVQLLSPLIKVEGYLLPSQPQTLQVVIINSNQIALDHVKLQLMLPGFQTSGEWQTLLADSQLAWDVILPQVNSKGDTQTLEWVLDCEGVDRHWQFRDQIEIPIRRFQVSQADELFGEME